MREVSSESFENLKSAIFDCLTHTTNVAGLKIAPPVLNEEKIEHAAVLALMAASGDWVRPKGLQFISGDVHF